jgi:hypothetical protein
MSHEQRTTGADTLLFFSKHPSALPVYSALEAILYEQFPEMQKRVQKTQITFFRRHVFACVSFQRVRRKAEMPDPFLVLSLGLPYPLNSVRVASQCEPYPGRWTVHVVVNSAEDLDCELISWIRQSYSFSESK